MTKETDLERIKKVVDWLIFDKVVKTKRELADKMGYTESSLSQIINGKVELSKRFINKLSIVDNRLNLEFLLTGEGEMLKSSTIAPQSLLSITEDRLLSIIESQQRTIEELSRKIK